MQVKINGAMDEIPDDASIGDVLVARELSLAIVVIVLNGEIIKREKWASLKLKSDDDLELIRIIGGG